MPVAAILSSAAADSVLTDAPTRAGKTAVKYHTARFALVPKLCEELAVSVPGQPGTLVLPGGHYQLTLSDRLIPVSPP